jgi:hypothetical protein
MCAHHLRLVPALALALWAGGARAQTRDAAGAEWLFREGRALMKQGDLPAACPKLEESLRFDPAVGTLMNLAECEERQGRTATAWQHWGAAADQLPPSDRRRATALARAHALESTLPRLTVETDPRAPAGLEVTRDGVVLGTPSLGVALPVDPGLHLIVAAAPGRAERRYAVSVDASKHQVLVVEPGPALAPPAPVAAPVVIVAQAAPVERPGRALGYGLLAGGAGALAAGTYFGVQALLARRDASADCRAQDDTHRCWSSAAGPLERDRRDSLIADVAFATGTLAIASGFYLLWRRSPRASVTAQVAAGPGGGGMEIAGRF